MQYANSYLNAFQHSEMCARLAASPHTYTNTHTVCAYMCMCLHVIMLCRFIYAYLSLCCIKLLLLSHASLFYCIHMRIAAIMNVSVKVSAHCFANAWVYTFAQRNILTGVVFEMRLIAVLQCIPCISLAVMKIVIGKIWQFRLRQATSDNSTVYSIIILDKLFYKATWYR